MHLRICRSCRDQSSWEFFGFRIYDDGRRASILGRYQDISEVGDSLQSVDRMKNMKLKFVLVIKNAEDVAWLAGPLAELKSRLLQVRKIWNIEVMVLNEELAEKLSLTC